MDVGRVNLSILFLFFRGEPIILLVTCLPRFITIIRHTNLKCIPGEYEGRNYMDCL